MKKFLELQKKFAEFKDTLKDFKDYVIDIKSIAKTMDAEVSENAVMAVEMFEKDMTCFMDALPLMRTVCSMIVIASDLTKGKADA